MGAKTEIAWTDHTFNPWWGCTRVSPGCEKCYAETFAKRTGFKVWGVDAGRRTFGEKHWKEPLKWNAVAEVDGVRRVFCASMADVFDKDAPPGDLARLWALIRETPFLDWQLLTKRPERIFESLPADWSAGYRNVWLGCTVEDQWRADERLPILLSIPAAIHFVSCEPLLGPVDLSIGFAGIVGRRPTLDWVIIGGESGGGARPFDVAWMRSLVKQCRAAGVKAFCKQLGAVVHDRNDAGFRGESESCWPQHIDEEDRIEYEAEPSYQGAPVRIRLRDRMGGDMAEWPPDLRIREFPAVRP